jgi:quinol-cytochrome oxidoreductase complex cytochrome b subunit
MQIEKRSKKLYSVADDPRRCLGGCLFTLHLAFFFFLLLTLLFICFNTLHRHTHTNKIADSNQSPQPSLLFEDE